MCWEETEEAQAFKTELMADILAGGKGNIAVQ